MTAYSGGRAERRPVFAVLGALLAALAMAFAGFTPASADTHPVETGPGSQDRCGDDAPYMGTERTTRWNSPGEHNYRFDIQPGETKQLELRGGRGPTLELWGWEWVLSGRVIHEVFRVVPVSFGDGWSCQLRWSGQTSLQGGPIQSWVFEPGSDRARDGEYWYRARAGSVHDYWFDATIETNP